MFRADGRLFSQIYSYLELKDLLNLSRTCKKFREFFLNRKMNESLWKQARINTDGAPERPPFLSEPAFVHLLYSPNCHVGPIYFKTDGLLMVLH